MSKRLFRVGRARTGLGLFAIKPIKKRTIIAQYRGPYIDNDEAERLEGRGARYIYEVNNKLSINGAPRYNLARYANHSCQPNAESYTYRRKVFIRAIRSIRPGTEITYHYGPDYFAAYIGRSRCRCTTCINRRNRRRAELRKQKQRKAKRAAAMQRRSRAAPKRKSAPRRRPR